MNQDEYEKKIVEIVDKQPITASDLSSNDKKHLQYLKDKASGQLEPVLPKLKAQIKVESTESDITIIEDEFERMEKMGVF